MTYSLRNPKLFSDYFTVYTRSFHEIQSAVREVLLVDFIPSFPKSMHLIGPSENGFSVAMRNLNRSPLLDTLLRKYLVNIPLHFVNIANLSFPSLPFRITDNSMFYIV
jgi:hypothetical protein